MTKSIVRRAVIPVGALDTRFLPAAKAVPKEMLPLVDRPLIQYAVEEARAAGIDEIVIVTGRGKGTIEDHFDCATELEDTLRRAGKDGALAAIESSDFGSGTIAYIRQLEPLGVAHALWCARHVVGDGPFALVMPDEVIQTRTPCLAQMIGAYAQVGGNLVAVTPAARSRTARHGVIAARRRDDRLLAAAGVDDWPGAGRWAIAGRCIFEPTILDCLGTAGDRPFADVIARCVDNRTLHAYAFAGRYFDCSDALGLFEANLAHILARSDLAPSARNLLSRYARLASANNRLRLVEPTARQAS